MAKTKEQGAKKTKENRSRSFGPRDAADHRDLADYFAAKARDNGRRIPMAVVHRKVS
jgi:hypothetical protein